MRAAGVSTGYSGPLARLEQDRCPEPKVIGRRTVSDAQRSARSTATRDARDSAWGGFADAVAPEKTAAILLQSGYSSSWRL
jgi:hypothetical protein